MLIYFLKSIHIFCALSLLGSAIFLSITSKENGISAIKINKAMLFFILMALVTGTVLVYPKHYTFHTPWIKAAYLLVIISFITTMVLFFLRKKNKLRFERVFYLLLVILFLIVVHDAITKTTFVFS